jgi:hypothetical protein
MLFNDYVMYRRWLPWHLNRIRRRGGGHLMWPLLFLDLQHRVNLLFVFGSFLNVIKFG